MHIPVKKLLDNLYSILSKPIYFDNNATTPLGKEVRSYMKKVQKTMYGNPSSMHLAGMKSREIIENARLQAAHIINASTSEIVFTSGGTEANNTIIKAAAELNPGAHFITSMAEHQSVLSVFKSLEKKGFQVTYAGLDNNGKADILQIRNSIKRNTRLISVMHVNNETGSVNDIASIARLAKQEGILFHSDIVQSFGKLKIDVKQIPVDYLSFSAHKIYGPKGCGAMYIREGSPFIPLIEGGHQERMLRSGTEALFNIAGFGKACEEMLHSDTEAYIRQISEIRSFIWEGAKKIFPEVKLNGSINGFASTLNLLFPGIPNNELISYLDYYNIAVSAGSACVAGSEEVSHVLLASGMTHEEASSSIRISIGKYNSLKDASRFLKILSKFKKEKNKFFDYVFPERISTENQTGSGRLFVDLRDEDQLERYSCFPGAIHIEPKLNELRKLPKEKEIILICEDGYLSNYFAPILRRSGFTNVRVMFGGHKRWRLLNKVYN
ncbi:MAG: aminotransferase class V-fold PLP-dependent enzyme [Bacillota bacterium]